MGISPAYGDFSTQPPFQSPGHGLSPKIQEEISQISGTLSTMLAQGEINPSTIDQGMNELERLLGDKKIPEPIRAQLANAEVCLKNALTAYHQGHLNQANNEVDGAVYWLQTIIKK